MTDTSNGEKISRAVRGEFALGLQRIFVIVGIPILLAVGGFLGVRAVTSVDDIGKEIKSQANTTQDRLEAIHRTLGDQSAAITVLQNTMSIRGAQRDQQINDIGSRVADHETRIRVLERPAR